MWSKGSTCHAPAAPWQPLLLMPRLCCPCPALAAHALPLLPRPCCSCRALAMLLLLRPCCSCHALAPTPLLLMPRSYCHALAAHVPPLLSRLCCSCLSLGHMPRPATPKIALSRPYTPTLPRAFVCLSLPRPCCSCLAFAARARAPHAPRPPHEAEAEAAALRAEVTTLQEALGVWEAAGSQVAALPHQQAPAALQRYRAQVWQQQRQVALMGAELKVRGGGGTTFC